MSASSKPTDVLGNEINVDDDVAVATGGGGSSAVIKIGRVAKLTPKGISIRITDKNRRRWNGNEYAPEPEYSYSCTSTSTKCIIINGCISIGSARRPVFVSQAALAVAGLKKGVTC